MDRWRGKPLFSMFRALVLIGSLALAACRTEAPADAPDPTPPPAAQADSTALASIDLRRADAATVIQYITDSPASVKVVNFWATWCVPCIEEFPELVRVGEDFAEQGVEVIFVSADFLEDEPRVRTFLQEHGALWTSFLKDEKDDPFIAAFDDRWMGSLPATFVYGPEDEKAWFKEGKTTYDELSGVVTGLL